MSKLLQVFISFEAFLILACVLVKIVKLIDQICSAHATMCTRIPKKEGLLFNTEVYDARYHSFDTNTFSYALQTVLKRKLG